MAQGHLRARRRWTMQDVVNAQLRGEARAQGLSYEPLAQKRQLQQDVLPKAIRELVPEPNRNPFGGFTFRLPWAPSVNNLHANRKDGEGRVKAKKAKLYADWAWAALLEQRVPCERLAHPLAITYVQHASSNAGDVANYEKILTDTLVRYGVIHDDRRDIVKRVTLEDGHRVARGAEYVEVSIACLRVSALDSLR